MSSWSTLKKVLVFGGGGLVLLVVLAGIFGEDPKKKSSTTTPTTMPQAAKTEKPKPKPMNLQAKADALSACMKTKVAGGFSWQTNVPSGGRSKKWNEVDHEAVVYGGKVIAVPVGVAFLKGSQQYWFWYWLADSPASAKTAASLLGDPNQEEELNGYNAQNVEDYGLWEDDKRDGTIVYTSDPTDADIEKSANADAGNLDKAKTACRKQLNL